MFSGCTSLEDIVIPASVKTIGSYAFDGKNKITSLESQITSLQKELTSKETALTDSIAENENINKQILTKTNELIKIKQDAVNEQQSLNDIITQHEKEINSLTSQNKAKCKKRARFSLICLLCLQSLH